MKSLSNAHTHTTYCDGKSPIADTLETAKRLGFVSLGFSGHAYQGFDPAYCMSPAHEAAYLRELRALQARPLPFRLYAGLEQDGLAPEDVKRRHRDEADYIIGSTHYLDCPVGDVRPAVDGDPALLKRCIDMYFDGDPLSMAERYFETHAAMIARDKPDVIGHFDLVRKYAERIGLNTGSPRYRQAARDALTQAYEGCRVLEVNTGNMARGSADSPYPADFLLATWLSIGGDVTLTSDCHRAELLDFAFEETEARLRRIGYTRLLRLSAGNELWEAVALD